MQSGKKCTREVVRFIRDDSTTTVAILHAYKFCGMCLGSGWSGGRAGMECDVERGGRRLRRRVQTRLSLIAQVVITRGRKEH